MGGMKGIMSGSGNEKEWKLRVVYMPGREYLKYFAKDGDDNYVETEPQRSWMKCLRSMCLRSSRSRMSPCLIRCCPCWEPLARFLLGGGRSGGRKTEMKSQIKNSRNRVSFCLRVKLNCLQKTNLHVNFDVT
jgi:hypothetical protein